MGQFRQFGLTAAGRDALGQITGVDDRAGHRHHLTHGRRGPMGRERAAEDSKEQRGRHHEQEGPPERLQQGFPAVGAPAHLQDRAVRQGHGRQHQIPLIVARHTQPEHLRGITPPVQRRGIELNPVIRHGEEQDAAPRSRHPDEEGLLLLRSPVPLHQQVQRPQAAAFIDCRALLHAGLDHLAVLALQG